MMQSHPAAVITSANDEPPGPDPTMTTRASSVALTPASPPRPTPEPARARRRNRRLPRARTGGWSWFGDLGVGPPAWHHVAGEVDEDPPRAAAVAAVHGVAVHGLARVLVQQRLERGR